MKFSLLLAIGFIFTMGASVPAQTSPVQGPGAQPEEGVSHKSLEFEVATIKPTNPNVMHMVGVNIYPGGRVVITNTLKSLVVTAFGLAYWQVSGGEPWVEKDNYDVEGKPPESQQASFTNLSHSWTEIGDDRLRGML